MNEANRYECTKDAPWKPEYGRRANHPDARDDGECYEGCCDFYKCPNCGLRFRVEANQ